MISAFTVTSIYIPLTSLFKCYNQNLTQTTVGICRQIHLPQSSQFDPIPVTNG